ncbi:UDP-glycosyltransferase 74F2-like [Senna tora]|uniref:Glycosyltransferase n=1 Tax=Senna tora TaxID=362788 RepID=A0A834TQL0_9FABA|nr:UDP-glycosyltransferase 74F2-like [Senna tora]
MEQSKNTRGHCLVLPFPTQGHINPMLQFSKRLAHKAIESISDGHDNGGILEAKSDTSYVQAFEEVGSKTLHELLQKLVGGEDDEDSSSIDCVVYDSFIPWVLEVTKKFGILGAPFFTQSCAVNSIYYHVFLGNLKIPTPSSMEDSEDEVLLLPALPSMETCDLPSFLYVLGPYPGYTKMLVDQFSNIEKADWVCDWQAKTLPLKTIGPTIPSMFLDKQLQDDNNYGFNLFNIDNNDACMKWLSDKPTKSVIYVSFGSLSILSTEQMEEIAWGLKESGHYFLWVVRASEQNKLPKEDLLAISENNKGFVVSWCPQLQVLGHESVGCFVTHCGWNSTVEGLSLGVPMVGLPQWTDQSTNAKYIKDVWRVGVKCESDEEGVVRREEVKKCVREVMESERGKEMRRNALKWKGMAAKACEKGGSSDGHIDEFVSSVVHFRNKVRN